MVRWDYVVRCGGRQAEEKTEQDGGGENASDREEKEAREAQSLDTFLRRPDRSLTRQVRIVGAAT